MKSKIEILDELIRLAQSSGDKFLTQKGKRERIEVIDQALIWFEQFGEYRKSHLKSKL